MISECQRCFQQTDRLYPMQFEDEDGGITLFKVCWDCDWDITNGGDFEKDASDIIQDRLENQYEYDPVNNVRSS